MAERVSLGDEILQALAQAVAANEETQRRFRTVVLRSLGIGGVKINSRQAKANARLSLRLVHGIDLLSRLGFVPGFEAN